MRCDVRDGAAVEAMIDVAEGAFGRLGVFVNNAGMTRDATMRTMTEPDFDDIVAVHLKGACNGTRSAANRMREYGSGAIVNISSWSGKVGFVGQMNDSAAKARHSRADEGRGEGSDVHSRCFSFVGCSEGECGSAKNTARPVAMVNAGHFRAC